MDIIFFENQKEFRKWLMKNHLKATELIVGFHKVNSGKPSMTWPQSVDEALCFGWIDAVRRSIDHESYCIRFTRRKPTSIWSAININKVENLKLMGLMMPAGIAAYEKRSEKRSRVYSYETEDVVFSKEFEKKFKANKKAWNYFNRQAPSYCKVATKWVMNAIQEATRIKRMEILINDCEAERKIKPLSY